MELRKGGLVFIMVFGLFSSKAQMVEEWTAQNNTQIKYLVKQILALKGYADLVAKGYAIVKEGATLIDAIKREDFHLHHDYFASLRFISPAIRDLKINQDIQLVCRGIQRQDQGLLKFLEQVGMQAEEKEYLSAVVRQLREERLLLELEFKTLSTANRYEMSDHERMERIARIHDKLLDAYRFIQGFAAGVKKLYLLKWQEATGIKTTKIVSGIK